MQEDNVLHPWAACLAHPWARLEKTPVLREAAYQMQTTARARCSLTFLWK